MECVPLTSEEIMKKTYAGLEQFLKSLLQPNDFDMYLEQKNVYFPTWSHMWKQIELWLRHHTFNNKVQTILSLAKIIPNINTFQYHLQNSLQLHEDFWNKVYANLIVAQSRLT